jgi:uncharacterized membrane protein
MFQTHCYDSWLGGGARDSKFFTWSQLGGTFPAPLFLFLAGISFAIVVTRLQQKDVPSGQVAKITIRRGAEIFALGLLFRLQEYAIALGWAPWTDLFRVDILNMIGVSLMLMGLLCWAALALRDSDLPRQQRNLIAGGLAAAAVVSALTPLFWTTWRPHFLPWELETYIDGVHNLGQPQPGLFPIFPWAAFAFAGLALGFLLMSDSAKRLGAYTFLSLGAAGTILVWLSKFLDSRQVQIYPVYDYWHTSPEFFMARVGMLLIITMAAYGWCRWGPGTWGFSPLIQLGQTSLLVYWVHIELVYGRFTILPRRANGIRSASEGLLAIFFAMLMLSLLRTNLRGRFAETIRWRRNSQSHSRLAESGAR